MPIDMLPYVLLGICVILLIAIVVSLNAPDLSRKGKTAIICASLIVVALCSLEYFLRYNSAEVRYHSRAASRDPDACYELGWRMLTYHKGAHYNPIEGIRLLKNAAEGGNLKAKLRLAACYLSGTSVPFDQQIAIYWLRAAADQNNKEAVAVLEAISSDPSETNKIVFSFVEKWLGDE
jgi:hypothetical protein